MCKHISDADLVREVSSSSWDHMMQQAAMSAPPCRWCLMNAATTLDGYCSDECEVSANLISCDDEPS